MNTDDNPPDDIDIIIEERRSISIYWNEGGNITILQPGPDGERNVVVVLPEDAEIVAANLVRIAENPPPRE